MRRETILICDDEPVIRALIRACLASRDARLLEATDGEAAIALLGSERPDLLLVDQMMPGRTGLEVVRAARAHPVHRDFPIVFLTGRAGESDRAEALAAGATAFLAKPFGTAELVALVDELLAEVRA